MYDISEFYNWLNAVPIDLAENDMISFEERGVREDAPESAKKAFKEYVQAINENGGAIKF